MNIKAKHEKFTFILNGEKFYQIFELDFRRNKKPFGKIFKGKNYHLHLPESSRDSYPKYEIQRIRCIPGKHEMEIEH